MRATPNDAFEWGTCPAISARIRWHFSLKPILQGHDRSKFEIHCLSNYAEPHPVTTTLRELADRWHDIARLDDSQVVDLIRREEIDILVDLSGHTDRHRLGVFARHPAPVQVTWLGYLNTTGLTTMDYRICDAHTDPEGETEHLHTERLVRMPHSQWCYVPLARDSKDSIDRTSNARTPSSFGSFNQYPKITDDCLAMWSRILSRVPHAELLVFDVRQAESRSSLRARMVAQGIDTARVSVRAARGDDSPVFRRDRQRRHRARQFPYNGATTTFDVLWMGVPLVAMRGERGISRGSYSILETLGKPTI